MKLYYFFGLLLTSVAQATTPPLQLWVQPVLNTQKPNTPTPYKVYDSFFAGDNVRIWYKSTQAGYLYLFNIDSTGHVDVLFPNRLNMRNYIQSQSLNCVPQESDDFDFVVSAKPLGLNTIIGLVSNKALSPQQLAQLDLGNEHTLVLRTENEFLDWITPELAQLMPNTWISTSTQYTSKSNGL